MILLSSLAASTGCHNTKCTTLLWSYGLPNEEPARSIFIYLGYGNPSHSGHLSNRKYMRDAIGSFDGRPPEPSAASLPVRPCGQGPFWPRCGELCCHAVDAERR